MTALVIGEVLVDLVWRAGAEAIVPLAGGSPANVAVGLHRLERPVRLATTWGDDVPGELVEAHLAATGLPIDRAATASGRTTLALAYVDKESGAATYDFLAAWDPIRFDIPPEVTLLHTGSLAIVVEPGAFQVREAARTVRSRPGGAVAVDLNVRPSAQPDRDTYLCAVHAMVGDADVLKASDEDLTWLYPESTPEEAARALLKRGPRLVVVTSGSAGAYGVIDGAEARCPAPAVDVVDTIGAGDSFQAALLAALLQPQPNGTYTVVLPTDENGLASVLRQAVTAGALACQQAGAQPPTRARLEAALTAQS
ncbi:PfkB family carbohydrate kinase [Streptomyces sp. NBC_00009]|uniref:PfkB family carbohydrate kinase n=1 Tax=Streptomyces sp. NBC_00009 TaxID=2975620 RepID=UPI003249290B